MIQKSKLCKLSSYLYKWNHSVDRFAEEKFLNIFFHQYLLPLCNNLNQLWEFHICWWYWNSINYSDKLILRTNISSSLSPLQTKRKEIVISWMGIQSMARLFKHTMKVSSVLSLFAVMQVHFRLKGKLIKIFWRLYSKKGYSWRNYQLNKQ